MKDLTKYLRQKSEIERLSKRVEALSLELSKAEKKLSEVATPRSKNKEFLIALLISKKTGNLNISLKEIAEKCNYGYYSVRKYSGNLKLKGNRDD